MAFCEYELRLQQASLQYKQGLRKTRAIGIDQTHIVGTKEAAKKDAWNIHKWNVVFTNACMIDMHYFDMMLSWWLAQGTLGILVGAEWRKANHLMHPDWQTYSSQKMMMIQLSVWLLFEYCSGCFVELFKHFRTSCEAAQTMYCFTRHVLICAALQERSMRIKMKRRK